MIPLGVAQSVHAYTPAGISHYRASWVDRNSDFPTPSWPLKDRSGRVTYDRARLEAHYAPWGENGLVVRTPESVEELIDWPGYDTRKTGTMMASLTAETVEAAIRKALG